MVGKTRFVAFCCRGSFNKFHCCQRVNKSHHHHVTQEAWLWSLMWTWFLHVFTKHESWWSHHDTLREKIAQAFIAELTRQSFAVVAVPVPMAAPVRGIFAAPETVLGTQRLLQGRWFGASKGKVNWRTEIWFSLHLPLFVVVMFSTKCIWCNVLYIVVIRLELYLIYSCFKEGCRCALRGWVQVV